MVEILVQTITIGDITLLLHAKLYCPDAITTILWPYVLKAFVEKLNKLKVDDGGITSILGC